MLCQQGDDCEISTWRVYGRVVSQRAPRRALAHADPAQERLLGARRVEDAAVALDERGRPALDPERRREVGAVEDVELDAAFGERGGSLVRPRPEVERAGRPEDLVARLGLELAPERQRALGLRDPVRVVVDE